MVIDDGGAIWLSNPWLVATALTLAVGLVLWCHRWLETGVAPTPRTLNVGTPRMARRQRSTIEAVPSAPRRPTERRRLSTVPQRRRAPTFPRTAA